MAKNKGFERSKTNPVELGKRGEVAYFNFIYAKFAVMLRLSINWKSIKKRVFTFWFNTRENALILLI
jgi:hypothetical protein